MAVHCQSGLSFSTRRPGPHSVRIGKESLSVEFVMHDLKGNVAAKFGAGSIAFGMQMVMDTTRSGPPRANAP